jgi:hypothetical protein
MQCLFIWLGCFQVPLYAAHVWQWPTILLYYRTSIWLVPKALVISGFEELLKNLLEFAEFLEHNWSGKTF